jgi:hypothetical protein
MDKLGISKYLLLLFLTAKDLISRKTARIKRNSATASRMPVLVHKNLLGRKRKKIQTISSEKRLCVSMDKDFLKLRIKARKMNPDASENSKLVSLVALKQSTPKRLKNCDGSKNSGPQDK